MKLFAFTHQETIVIIILRGNWEISRRDLTAPRFITMVTTDRDFVESDFDDDYSAPNSRSLIYCRVVAIIVISLSLI